MIGSLKSGMRRTRFILMALVAVLSTALIITPAGAAGEFAQLDGGHVAAVCIFGTLLFAVVFEIRHLTASKPATGRLNQNRD